MAIPVGLMLCVDAMGTANVNKKLAYPSCKLKFGNCGRGGAVSGNLRVGAIMRTGKSGVKVGGCRRTRLPGGQGMLNLRRIESERILVGNTNGLCCRERYGGLCVRASKSGDEKDLRFSQQVRERSDSEEEKEEGGLSEAVNGEESAASISALHEDGPVTPDYGSRRPFRNRFLGLVKLRSNIAEAAEGVFKSEIRRRIFVTIVLLMASRAGYFIPLPGFDRRSMPGDYLGFVSGAVEELGDAVSELKLSVFQLGISPYILSSIVMQVSCHLVPALVKLRKEGIDGNEKIKKYTWWLAFGVAVVESLGIAIHSIPYSLYAAQNRFSYLFVTVGLLTLGAVTLNWICDKITEAGFGQGSSLIICIGILKGYSETLLKMLMNLNRRFMHSFNLWLHAIPGSDFFFN